MRRTAPPHTTFRGAAREAFGILELFRPVAGLPQLVNDTIKVRQIRLQVDLETIASLTAVAARQQGAQRVQTLRDANKMIFGLVAQAAGYRNALRTMPL